MTDREKAAFLNGIWFASEFLTDRGVHKLLADASVALGFSGPDDPAFIEIEFEMRQALAAGGFEGIRNLLPPEERN
jgi:hypothetical protein